MKWNERRKLERESWRQERTRKTWITERSRGRSQKRKRLDDTEKGYAYLLAMGMYCHGDVSIQGNLLFAVSYFSILTETQFRPSQFQWHNSNGLLTITDPTHMAVMGAALHGMICIRETTSPWSWNAGMSKRWNWQIYGLPKMWILSILLNLSYS